MTFTNADGAPANPTTVTIKVKDPTGARTSITLGIVNDGVGKYHYDLPLTKAGQWFYRFEGTGAVTAADEKFFTVQKSAFA